MCGGNRFWTVINLGEHPLVNSLISKERLNEKEPTFPLVVKQCQKCRLVQLTDVIDAEEIYRNVDYLFFSSDMPGLENYFLEYADDVKGRFLKNGDLVVEIGSNDGILLNLFKDRARVLGADPATNVVLRALKRGLPTVSGFFTERLGRQIAKEWGPAKVVCGNNCIAHLNDLHDLVSGARALMADDGVFIIECNYWGGMVKNTNYSLIYLDHYSYFSLAVWQNFAKQYGMRVFDAWVTPAQGGSLRMFLSKNGRPVTKRLKQLEKEEQETNLNTRGTSVMYRKNVCRTVKGLRRVLEDLKAQGKKLAGYGAAAKGFTILRCSNIGSDFLDYFVDDSPAKQGWYSPLDHIPIISRQEATKQLPDYFVILAPNYAPVILEKEEEFRKQGGKFVLPVEPISII